MQTPNTAAHCPRGLLVRSPGFCVYAATTRMRESITDPTTQLTATLWSPGTHYGYAFVIQESSLITARVTSLSGDMDPVLRLIDETGSTLAEDDDSGGNGDALIEDVLVEQPGRYAIIVGSYGDEGTGPFELLVEIQGDE